VVSASTQAFPCAAPRKDPPRLLAGRNGTACFKGSRMPKRDEPNKAWLAVDFRKERDWKLAMCKFIAEMVCDYHEAEDKYALLIKTVISAGVCTFVVTFLSS